MSLDDVAFMIAFGFMSFAVYAGMKRLAEAIDTFSARIVRRQINVTLPTIDIIHHNVEE